MRKVFAPFALVLALLAWVPSAWSLEIQEVVSPGGVTAWLVEDRSNPILTL